MSRARNRRPERAAVPSRETASPVRQAFNEAVALHQAGNLAEAQRRYLEILSLDVHHADSLHLLGMIEHQLEHNDTAVKLIHRAIAASPREARFYSNLGIVLRAQGKLDEAAAACRQALDIDPGSADAHNNLGLVLQDQGRLNEAEEAARKAASLRPEHAPTLNNLGLVLKARGRLDEAEVCIRRALELQPDFPEALNNLGKILVKKEDFPAAASCAKQALILRPVFAEAQNTLGMALFRQNELSGAVASLERALELKPNFVEAHTNLGLAQSELGDRTGARAHLERALALSPNKAEARFGLSFLQLLEGDFAAGWSSYESRHRIARIAVRHLSQPQWRGEPLNGARILLHDEQGLGDTLQFLRYVPMVKAAGGRVILHVQAGLRSIASVIPDIDSLDASDGPLPACEWQCPLMSLPLAFSTRLETIPANVPYLSIPEEARVRARALSWPSDVLRVGLVWAGNPKHARDAMRSIALHRLKPLLDLQGVQFFSLQTGPAAEQLQDFKSSIVDLGPAPDDMAETAARMEQLDLVLTVDTSIAHLAGALGLPCWMLLPSVPDWRWMLETDGSPWYPTLRLFRQQTTGDWETVVQRIGGQLSALIAGDRAVLKPRFNAPAVPQQARSASSVAVQSGEVERRRATIASGATDTERWADISQLERAWDARARRAADYVPAGATVLDLGCGRMALEPFLQQGCRYIPCDLVPRDSRTVVCDFNLGSYPDAEADTADIVVLLGVLEYIFDPRAFLQHLRRWHRPVVLSYCVTDSIGDAEKRKDLGWVNDFSLNQIVQLFGEAGFAVQRADRVDNLQWIFRLAVDAQAAPVVKTVGVLSFQHVGNFGDRLGYHLVNDILPAHAEVTHLALDNYQVPDKPFDLLIVGIGNSMFGPFLDDKVLRLVENSRASVGIFGTQYHDSLPKTMLHALVERLDHWYARHQEDVLRYGRGHANVTHLGDWLIRAFPLVRPTRNERLDIGAEVWDNLPLDRSIQSIQQFAAVFSPRIHPLLCALTSAERVAYREQREQGGPSISGKFRSMFIDIFGRDFPEEQFFEVDRMQVVRYKRAVEERVQQMSAHLRRML